MILMEAMFNPETSVILLENGKIKLSSERLARDETSKFPYFTRDAFTVLDKSNEGMIVFIDRFGKIWFMNINNYNSRYYKPNEHRLGRLANLIIEFVEITKKEDAMEHADKLAEIMTEIAERCSRFDMFNRCIPINFKTKSARF